MCHQVFHRHGRRHVGLGCGQVARQVLDRARSAMAKELNIPVESIRDDTDLVADLHLDSLDSLRVVFAVEEEFGVEIPDESLPDDTGFRVVVEHLLASAQPETKPPPPQHTSMASSARPQVPCPAMMSGSS